jgi:hypothetical protein
MNQNASIYVKGEVGKARGTSHEVNGVSLFASRKKNLASNAPADKLRRSHLIVLAISTSIIHKHGA